MGDRVGGHLARGRGRGRGRVRARFRVRVRVRVGIRLSHLTGLGLGLGLKLAACSAQWCLLRGNVAEKSRANRESPTRGAAKVYVLT